MADLPAYLAHIVSQTRQNITFLISQNKISSTDGDDILAKLPTLDDTLLSDLSVDTHAAAIAPLSVSSKASMSVASPITSVPESRLFEASPVHALAKWDYSSQDSTSDLSFRAGDIIEVITEPHRDWWNGRNLKCGLFPSVYVEKMTTAVMVASPASSLSQLPATTPPESSMSQYTPPYFPRQNDTSVPSHMEHVRNGSVSSVMTQDKRRNLPKALSSTLLFGQCPPVSISVLMSSL